MEDVKDKSLQPVIRASSSTASPKSDDLQNLTHRSNLHWHFPARPEACGEYAASEARPHAFFALLPSYRRRSLGGHVIESLLHKNGGTLTLHIRASNGAARRFYDGLASARISVTIAEDGRYDNGDERMRYVLALRPDRRLS